MNNKSGSEQDFCSCDIQMIPGGVFEVSNMKPLTHSACGKPLRLHSVDAYKDHPFTNGVVQRQAEQIVRLQKLVEEASLQAKYKDIANARMDEIHRLQKLCEEQRSDNETLKNENELLIRRFNDTFGQFYGMDEQLHYVIKTERERADKIEVRVRELDARVEEQKGDIERFKKSILDYEHDLKMFADAEKSTYDAYLRMRALWFRQI